MRLLSSWHLCPIETLGPGDSLHPFVIGSVAARWQKKGQPSSSEQNKGSRMRMSAFYHHWPQLDKRQTYVVHQQLSHWKRKRSRQNKCQTYVLDSSSRNLEQKWQLSLEFTFRKKSTGVWGTDLQSRTFHLQGKKTRQISDLSGSFL